MSSVLSCYFPTTVVMVDDSKIFLDGLESCLNVKDPIFKKFTNPELALDFINNNEVKSFEFEDLITEGEESSSDWRSLLINVYGIHNEIYNKDRFKKISTVTVDYAMPTMNGVEFCRRIKDKNIQKILLTGIADEAVAIEAFNTGAINRYIKKGDPKFADELEILIEKSRYMHFMRDSNFLAQTLCAYGKTHLKDPIFANFFHKIWSSKNFSEYYMLDHFGSYIFLNKKGSATCLFVLTESELNKLVEAAVESGDASEHVLQALQSREFMLVHYSNNGTTPPVSEWGNYLYPAKKLDGYQTYYCTFNEISNVDIDHNKVRSFEEYINNFDGMHS